MNNDMHKHKTLDDIDFLINECIRQLELINNTELTPYQKRYINLYGKNIEEQKHFIFKRYYQEGKIIKKFINDFIPNKLYMYQPLNEKKDLIFKALSNRKLYFRSVDNDNNDEKNKCNDNTEFKNIKLLDKNDIKAKYEDIDWLIDSFIKSRENFRINCLSQNHPLDSTIASESMWDRYASKKTGICVEIDFTDKNNIYLKKYLRKVVYIENEIYVRELIDKVFNLDFGSLSNIIFYDIFEASLRTKLKVSSTGDNWEEEREVRLISGKENELDDFFQLCYQPNKVYFTEYISDTDKERLIKISNELGISIEKI